MRPKRSLDPGKLKAAAVFALCVVAAALLFKSGLERLAVAKKDYLQAKMSFQQNMDAAASVPALKAQAACAKRRWEDVKVSYATFVDGGLFFDLLDKLCQDNGVQDVTAVAAGTDTGFFRNHLHARYYALTLRGPFPKVYSVFYRLEASGLPVEVKPLKITVDGADVTAGGTVVLYSLNPLEKREWVAGPSGGCDPFFNFDIRML